MYQDDMVHLTYEERSAARQKRRQERRAALIAETVARVGAGICYICEERAVGEDGERCGPCADRVAAWLRS